MQRNISDLDPNKAKIKNYNIIKIIGFGASGIIYQVYKRDDKSKEKKILILKQIPFTNIGTNLEETTELLKKAKNESLILSTLDFKYIVKYYESFIEDDCLNIIMDYYEKGDLNCLIEKLIQKKKYLTEEKIWHFFIQLSIGLQYIHQKKIIHRDLKPMNIFLTKNNLIKIGDLGVAKIIHSQTKANTFLGTPYYMSPELCEGKPYNFKSDVWALGCILYELCSLQKPFNAFNQAALCMKIIEGKYIPLCKLKRLPSYCKKFDYFIKLMIEKDCEKRPYTKDILINKNFYEKAKELGYENDIQFVLNIDSNKKSNNNKKNRMTPNCFERNKKIVIRRLNSSACSNKKSIKKIPRLNSYKISNKKLKRKYKILSSCENNIEFSKDKSTIEPSFKPNISNSRNREINYSSKNILTSINNYQADKKKFCHPNINLKKTIIKNNLISKVDNNKLDTKYNQFINLNNENNITPYNNTKFIIKNSKEKEKSEILKETTKANIPLKFINRNFNNEKPKERKLKGIKILSIDKKYSSFVKSSFNNINEIKEENSKKIKVIKKIQRKKSYNGTIINLNKKIKLDKSNYIKQNKGNDSYIINKHTNNTSFEHRTDTEEFIITQNTSKNTNINNEVNSDEENEREEKVSIIKLKEETLINNGNLQKEKEELLLKYNEYKEEILKYKEIIDINKLFDLYEQISKNNGKIEDISKKIESYLKTNLSYDNYKKLKRLFKNFIFYDINIENINRFN